MCFITSIYSDVSHIGWLVRLPNIITNFESRHSSDDSGQFQLKFYNSLKFRIEIIHGRHMYIVFKQVGLYVSFLPLADAWGKTS
jgi:hypothetical protein